MKRVVADEDLRFRMLDIRVEDSMRLAGYRVDEVYLMPYSEYTQVENRLKDQLRAHGVDLSFASAYVTIPGLPDPVKIGGNVYGIVANIYYAAVHHFWIPTSVDAEDIEDAPEVFMCDRFGHPEKVSPDQLIQYLGTPKSRWTYTGYGSQASSTNWTTDWYMDPDGRVMMKQSALVYD